MAEDTTTIEIFEEQAEQLRALKTHDRESYKAVIGRLLESGGETEGDGPLPEELVESIVAEIGATVGGPKVDDQELAREVACRIDYAELAKKTADEIEVRLS